MRRPWHAVESFLDRTVENVAYDLRLVWSAVHSFSPHAISILLAVSREDSEVRLVVLLFHLHSDGLCERAPAPECQVFGCYSYRPFHSFEPAIH